MSQIPSYSPSILVEDNMISERHGSSGLNEGNSADLNDEDRIISPHFFYSQGNYKSYFDKLLDQQRKNEQLLHTSPNDQAQTRRKLKRKRDSSLRSSLSTSYIVRRDRSGARGRYVIKINIHELTDSDHNCSDSDDACVSVQYVVRETFDDVMDATQALVKKICNNLE